MWRMRYLVERRLHSTPVTYNDSPSATYHDFPDVPVFHRPSGDEQVTLDNLRRGKLYHLNRAHAIDNAEAWNSDCGNRLWAITAHYHYWIYDLALAVRDGVPDAWDLLQYHWQAWRTVCGRDSSSSLFAWNSFAIATRISWWIRALLVLQPQLVREHSDWEAEVLNDISVQAEYLSKHIEWDLRANHVLRDAVGLAWAGRFLCGEQAKSWMRQATEIAMDQVDEQILPDGGHFERSPMYHIHIMEDVWSLQLLLEDESAREKMRCVWNSMANVLRSAQFADGQIPLLNDSAQHAVADPSYMVSLQDADDCSYDANNEASPDGQRSQFLADTGLVVWHETPWTLFFDVGDVGPDCQPGHAHADTLNAVCAWRGKQLFVDPGTYGYDRDVRRVYDRSTAAHNTVCIDGIDSSEVWDIFRVGRRARPHNVRVSIETDNLFATASHDGYRHLPGQPTHQRDVEVINHGVLRIHDRVDGSGTHQVQGGMLLDPGWEVETCLNGWKLSCSDHLVSAIIETNETVESSVVAAKYHPEYGKEIDTQRIQWTFNGPLPVDVRLTIQSVS